MSNLTLTDFETYCREHPGFGHHTLRAYARDLRTFARYAEASDLADPLSRDDILGSHRHLRETCQARSATIQRRLFTLRAYSAWREDRHPSLPSPFKDVRIAVRVPRTLPRLTDRSTLRAVFQSNRVANHGKLSMPSHRAASFATKRATILILKLLVVTGLRIGGLMGLRVGDVTNDGGQIRPRLRKVRRRVAAEIPAPA
ncbi:MAG: site-specific integrase [Paracoccaceae bacterium]